MELENSGRYVHMSSLHFILAWAWAGEPEVQWVFYVSSVLVSNTKNQLLHADCIIYIFYRIMGIFGRGVAIVLGTFVGGGLGFYIRETYMLKVKKKTRSELEGELTILTKSREEKEIMLIQNRKIN